jgi:Peptidase family M48
MTALPYLLHGATLALAWFLMLNVAATLLVAIVSAALGRRAASAPPGVWLALRLAPAALSVVFAAGIFLPSYWRYEPREFVEGFDVTLTALAVAALVVAGAGIARGVRAWRRAAERTSAWMRTARPVRLPGTTIPAFAIDADGPVMALVGIVRPRLLITRPVLDALSDEELRAGVAHEMGHRRALDNLKRLAMRSTPDLLSLTAVARSLEHRWAAASEYVADRAAGDSGIARCALASALVKVARLTPSISTFGEPISALVDQADITTRVERLLDDATPAQPRGHGHRVGALAAAAALVLAYAPLLKLVHDVTEILVNTLP